MSRRKCNCNDFSGNTAQKERRKEKKDLNLVLFLLSSFLLTHVQVYTDCVEPSRYVCVGCIIVNIYIYIGPPNHQDIILYYIILYYIIYFKLVVYIVTCTVYMKHCI